ncbi:MAG: hypothetical protein H6575_00760 [Lewinellaceae bacterium]|nr:hypothetical protein [Lewinellaceae bacterium]
MEDLPPRLTNEVIKVGVIVGAGTGRRLADIFKTFLQGLVDAYSDRPIKFEFDMNDDGSEYMYHSYQSLLDAAGDDTAKFDELSTKQAERLVGLTTKWYNKGVRTIFRTSVNAEALYLFRQKVKAVKEFGLETNSGSRILFVRDQAEGFYANESYRIENDAEIHFNGSFTKAHQQQVSEYALQAAQRFIGENRFRKWALYKHHLFGNVLENWIRDVDPEIKAFQPDNGLPELNNIISKEQKPGGEAQHILIICSNEVGDIVYETILGIVNIEPKLELYSRNIYLAPPFSGNIQEYQTVHGSADDIGGTEKIIPYATLRIAADIAEKQFNIANAKDTLELAISETKRKRLTNTSRIVSEVNKHFHKNNGR